MICFADPLPKYRVSGSDILILAVSIDPIRPCLSAESMQRAREEIVRDASVSFRAFSSRGVPSDKDNSIHVERRKPMFKENCSSVPAALILSCMLGVSAAQAQGTGCYTLESLQGAFGVIGT